MNCNDYLTLRSRDNSPNTTYEYNYPASPIELPHIERRNRVLDTPVTVKIRQLSRRRDGQVARGSRTRRIRARQMCGPLSPPPHPPPRDNWRGRVSVCVLHSGSIISTPVRVHCCPAICFVLSLRHNYSVDRTLRESMNFCFFFLNAKFVSPRSRDENKTLLYSYQL